MKLWAALILFLIPGLAQAKLETVKDEKFGSYLILTNGKSEINKTPYQDEYNTTTNYSGGISSNTSGEFGFVWASQYLSLRFGFELLSPPSTAADATNASGQTIYNVGTSVNVFFPKVGLELNFLTKDWYRVYGFGYVGEATIDVKNTYTENTISSPSGNFNTEYKGNCNASGGGLGIEMNAFDNANFTMELSYRDMDFGSLSYTGTTNTVSDYLGNHNTGDTVKDAHGWARDINLSGAYIALGFRFWLF